MAPPAADEVSAGIARLFAEHAQDFHAVAQQATTYQQQFVKALTASGSSYAAAEDSIASLLQAVDANVAYYTTAGRALLSMLVNIPTAIVGFLVIPLLWPILPLLPFLVAQQFLTLFLEVLTGARFRIRTFMRIERVG